MSAARFLVRGKVQGVWFRAATRERAERLQIAGQARNLPDGSVEVLAYGSTEAIEALEAWLTVGPPLAKVTDVVRQPLSDEGRPGEFSAR